MASRLYNEQNQQGMMTQFQSFMQNPMQFLMQKRINVPQELANDPHGAVQHLLNSGQMSQEQLNMLTKRAQQMGLKFK